MRYVMMCLATTMLYAAAAVGKNIDLATVPDRETVQLTIYNAEDLTLVRETRVVSFNAGANRLQFSWANTLIDPTSVELRFLDRPETLSLLDTTFPHDKPQMLYWNVHSERAGEARVEISYFTSGITWTADYVGVASPDESHMRLEGYVTVRNQSGEDYEDAQVRLVVGTINLVEKIAELARRGLVSQDAVRRGTPAARSRAMREMVERADPYGGFAGAAVQTFMDEEKQIVKEGLSEYFIFTIEGTETIPNQWAKRMRSFEAAEAPVRVQYRYRPREYGDQLVRMFLLTNDSEAGLGESPLPDGVVRIFRDTDADSLAYLGEQPIRYIPVGDEIELNLGPDPNVVFELRTLRVYRDEVWLQLHGADVLHRADEPGLRIDPRSRVVGWDEHTIYSQQIRNYTDKPIDVEVRRMFPGDVVFRSELDAKAHDFQTVQFEAGVEPAETADLLYEVTVRQGRNAKQNRVELEAGPPAEVPWMRR